MNLFTVLKHVASDLYGVVSIDNYLTYSPLLQPLTHTYARNITLIIRFTIQFKHFNKIKGQFLLRVRQNCNT